MDASVLANLQTHTYISSERERERESEHSVQSVQLDDDDDDDDNQLLLWCSHTENIVCIFGDFTAFDF